MSKHTPGPWEIGNHQKGLDKWPAHYAVSQVGEMYDHAFVFSVQDSGEGKSNVQLIAAAPELLEACEHALGILDDCPTSLTLNLRKVIAKDKGEAVDA